MSSEYILKDDVYRILCTNVVSHSDGIEAVNKTIYDIEELESADAINIQDIGDVSICGKIDDLFSNKISADEYDKLVSSMLYAPIMYGEKVVGTVTKVVGGMWFGVLMRDYFINVTPSIVPNNGYPTLGCLRIQRCNKSFWNTLNML